ncbi:hypothetical protein AR454_00995 [Bacillus mycoides]|uniref:spore coat protein CotJB n=1 Tax=Bacillus mycoides TaxID=1405 RepID=UPI001E3BE5A6|nr:spore coat protein CotJB [Bacillus mycoides]MCD4642475.1 hypothetical protein [Bacillus mycoides]
MSRENLLLQIQQLEFFLLELQLYLDTHPSDEGALMQFNKYSKTLQQLKLKFDKKYGPLLGFGFSESKNTWKWIDNPWPWQINNR